MIRRMRQADVDQVFAIEKRVQTHPWTKKQFEEAVDQYQCHVIEHQNEVVAFCLMQPVLDEANLLLMAVDPKHQGKGLGTQILEKAISDLGDSCVQIFLEVRESNRAAIGLYEKTGFHQIDLRKNYYPNLDGTKEHAIIMVKMTNDNPFGFKE